MLNGRRNVPDDQLVVCSGFELSRLDRSTNPAMRVPKRRMPFSTRISAIVTLSIRRVPIGSARIRTLP